MPGLDRAGRHGSRPHTFQEIVQMRFQEVAGVGSHRLFLPVHLPAAAVDNQRPPVATECHCRAATFLPVRTPQTVFPGDGLSRISVVDK